MAKRQTYGIECERCGAPTTITKTLNYVTWVKRIRLCTNEQCLHAFVTKEIKIDPKSKSPATPE